MKMYLLSGDCGYEGLKGCPFPFYVQGEADPRLEHHVYVHLNELLPYGYDEAFTEADIGCDLAMTFVFFLDDDPIAEVTGAS